MCGCEFLVASKLVVNDAATAAAQTPRDDTKADGKTGKKEKTIDRWH